MVLCDCNHTIRIYLHRRRIYRSVLDNICFWTWGPWQLERILNFLLDKFTWAGVCHKKPLYFVIYVIYGRNFYDL